MISLSHTIRDQSRNVSAQQKHRWAWPKGQCGARKMVLLKPPNKQDENENGHDEGGRLHEGAASGVFGIIDGSVG
jgi:hypothetical protein